MLAYTNEARQSNIDKIGQLIEVLGRMTDNELGYFDYRAIVDYLSILRDLYKNEIKVV